MAQRFSRIATVSALLLLLAGCSLPRGAALQTEILSKSAIGQSEFAIYQVDRDLLPKVAKWPRIDAVRSQGWIGHKRGPVTSVIVAGDKLNLSIWDSDENSLLTAPGQKTVVLNEVAVSPDGTIFVPYLDRIYVKGQTPDQARETIQKQIEVIINSAQVQLTLVTGRQGSVDLVGGVANAGSYPLPDRNFSVLNLISLGGGVSSSLRNPQIRLIRGNKTYATSVSRLYANPALDTTLRGGDKVIIQQDARYFLALGAVDSEAQISFPSDRISALDAMSLAGGLADARANPKGILILREYPKRAVKSNGRGPSQTRVVFVVDLTSADGLFSAGKFQVQSGDLVLVTESPVTSVQTVFSLIGQAVGLAKRL